ncbi:hypothetical protein LQZ19_04625 [Treponema primitia]|uniref:hypothetical protein n=1 Tax=Treponema primitia TaxID=88058 RepID=UPI00397FC3A9
MKALLIIILLLGIFSCTSKPTPQPEVIVRELETPKQEEPAVVQTPAAVVVEEKAVVEDVVAVENTADFDPKSITKEEFNSTKEEMQRLIEDINRIIRAKDYAKWINYLADDFIQTINSPAFLAELSESSRQLKGQNIVLKTSLDYFTYVVVASRENIRTDASLDDIEFLSHNRVKAYTINARKQRLRLFEFVRDGGAWKIAFSG